MQVILSQDEIISALEQYVRNQISIKEGQTIVIDLKAGRGENGFTANLDIQQATKTASVAGSVSIDSSGFKATSAEVVSMTPVPAFEANEPSAMEPEAKPAGSIFSFAKTSNE
jgi:hypothetical protein